MFSVCLFALEGVGARGKSQCRTTGKLELVVNIYTLVITNKNPGLFLGFMGTCKIQYGEVHFPRSVRHSTGGGGSLFQVYLPLHPRASEPGPLHNLRGSYKDFNGHDNLQDL